MPLLMVQVSLESRLDEHLSPWNKQLMLDANASSEGSAQNVNEDARMLATHSDEPWPRKPGLEPTLV